jgi:hypothetical protein
MLSTLPMSLKLPALIPSTIVTLERADEVLPGEVLPGQEL